MSPVEQTELLFILLLIFVIGFGSLARLVKIPYPIVLVIAGLVLSFVPRLPRFHLNPDLVFLAILPPLLFSAAYTTSWRDLRTNAISVALLAVGLVGFTVLGVAFIAHFLLPEFDWHLGLVLGAVVAPTDAIAATSVAKRLRLPKRIIDLLEGESLVNDASGLLALEFTTAWIVSGQAPSLQEGALRLAVLVFGGVLVGLLVGKVAHFLETRLDDTPIEITLSLVVPYIAYIGAEKVHCSGVLSAVAAGLYLGSKSSYGRSSAVRIEAYGFWNTFTFVLNGLVFLLIGLQLPFVLGEIHTISVRQLFFDAVEFNVAVILLRLIWAFPGAYLAQWIECKISKHPRPHPSVRGIFVVGWTGMRGVISLAAAIALPEVIANGSPFPQRNVILFLTFSIIFVTLVLQGLTLPFLIRRLGLALPAHAASAEAQARRLLVQAAVEQLSRMREQDDKSSASIYETLIRLYTHRLTSLPEENAEATEDSARFQSIARTIREYERSQALQLLQEEIINDEIFRTLERELDLRDLSFADR